MGKMLGMTFQRPHWNPTKSKQTNELAAMSYSDDDVDAYKIEGMEGFFPWFSKCWDLCLVDAQTGSINGM